MEYGRATIEDDLLSAEMGTSRQPVYDRDFELKLLHQDPRSGAEHYVVRYPPVSGRSPTVTCRSHHRRTQRSSRSKRQRGWSRRVLLLPGGRGDVPRACG
jgi:hypothetical protein